MNCTSLRLASTDHPPDRATVAAEQHSVCWWYAGIPMQQKNATSSESRHGRQNSSKLMSPLRFWHRLWYECPEFMSCICNVWTWRNYSTFRNEKHQEFPKLKHVFNRTASGEFTKTAPNLPQAPCRQLWTLHFARPAKDFHLVQMWGV